METTIIAISNQKGGVGKSTTAYNLGACLALKHDKKVLLIDFDPQANLSEYLKYEPDGNPTMTQLIMSFYAGNPVTAETAQKAIRHSETAEVDYIPADINLANAETLMVTMISKEHILRRILTEDVIGAYDFVLIDCLPSLGTLLINALTAADRVLIPVQTQKFSMDGLQSLEALTQLVKANTNPNSNMKKFITAVFCTALALSSGFTAYAAEAPDRESLETAIWEDLWNGKGDNGLEYPEASYKHHLLDNWLDENYGTGGYDWTDVGEVTHGYRKYYRDLIDGWDFDDDNSGNWTIETEDNFYSFTFLNGNWQMIDQNGDTVDTFPPFSTLKDEPEESTGGHQINDNGEDSPRVIGEVAGGTETTSEGGSSAEGNDTPDSPSSVSEGDSERSGANPLAIIAGVASLAGVGGAGYYIMKKRK